ncbi:MAG: ABC transporter substrate-binding protein, partial [Mycobacteriales bacterium]
TGSVAGTKCSTLGQNVPGVTPTEIRIGIHAPQTGTGAPLPPSFQAGAAVYWKTHKVCGRTVVVDFQDDKYTPSTARAVCEPMSRRDFLVVGAAGTDQIQSCATDPAIAGKVPYLSAGVTTNGLVGLSNYFAFTLTYAQQATLVLQNAKNQGLGMKRWAVITSNTNNFKDARDAMEGVLKSAGVPYDDIQVNATNDNGLQGRAAATGAAIASGCPAACKYDTVFLDTSPGYFIYMSGTASKQAFSGTYTGPGVTMTEVTVAQLVCKTTAGVVKANFLAPYPGIDRATSDFKAATGGSYDDIYWSLWGLSQAIDQALQNSSSLTRDGFISSLQQASLPGGVYNPIKFGGGHFGGTGAFSQVMNCNKSEPNAGAQNGAWDTVGQAIFK